MNEEIERTRKALGEAIACLQRLATLGGISSVGNEMAREGLAKVESLLNPPPAMEDVNIVRWECGCGHIHKTAEAPKICNGACGDGWCNGKGPFTKLTGTIKRPVKRAVIREYEVAGKVDDNGLPRTLGGTPYLFADHPECHGKEGVLIFRTAE